MAGDSGQERTEQPTDRRKKEARKKGQVAKSVDLTGAAVFLVIVSTLPSVFSSAGKGLLDTVRGSMSSLPTDASIGSIGRNVQAAISPMLMPLAMLMGAVMVTSIVATVGQTGFLFATEAIQPKFSKMNPANGLKQIFSRVSVFNALKALFKSSIFAFIAYSVISARWSELGMLWSLTPLGSLSLIGEIAKTILLRIGVAWLVIAAIDYFFQRKQVDSQLKMTKEEVKQEMKDAETSPELKMAQDRRRREMSKKRTAQAVKTADVIITNPTHYAVAITYDSSKNVAPVVVAKGVDQMALHIRKLANEAKVPIIENRPLARALYAQCEVGDYVPRDLFQGVAEVLAYVYRTVKKARA